MRVMGIWKTVAHTDPSPNVISPPVPEIPARIVAINLPERASTREIVPSPWFNVQTESAPTVRKRGCGPTGIELTTSLDCGSTRVSRLCSLDVTQTPPAVNAG